MYTNQAKISTKSNKTRLPYNEATKRNKASKPQRHNKRQPFDV